jgi:hypothetical protein
MVFKVAVSTSCFDLWTMKWFKIVHFCFLAALAGSTERNLQAHGAEDMAVAARTFLEALSPEQRAKATLEFRDDERQNWHFVPRQRRGISLKELTPAQLPLAYGFLASGLSHQGFLKATTIVSLEEVLREMEQGRGPVRDPELYYFSVFGKPGARQGWGWRFEGHHLSLNFTIVQGEVISVTPSFLGANPAEVRSGPRQGLRVLAMEEDLGRQLIRSMDSEQRGEAIISDKAPRDIITGADRKAGPLSPRGVMSKRLTESQRQLLWQLLEEYVRRHRPDVAKVDLEKIREAGVDEISFAWAGPVEPGRGHYYRVQGPTFLLEYDNTQDGANHIHTVWRDFENDFGEDLLRKHYEQHRH